MAVNSPLDINISPPIEIITVLKNVSSASQLFAQLLKNKNYKNKVELALAIADEYRSCFQQEPPMGLIQGIILWNRDLAQVKKGRGISDKQLDDIVNQSLR